LLLKETGKTIAVFSSAFFRFKAKGMKENSLLSPWPLEKKAFVKE